MLHARRGTICRSGRAAGWRSRGGQPGLWCVVGLGHITRTPELARQTPHGWAYASVLASGAAWEPVTPLLGSDPDQGGQDLHPHSLASREAAPPFTRVALRGRRCTRWAGLGFARGLALAVLQDLAPRLGALRARRCLPGWHVFRTAGAQRRSAGRCSGGVACDDLARLYLSAFRSQV